MRRTHTVKGRVACIYARISQDAEATELGVSRQIDECKRLASDLGFEVGQQYVDNDISATKGKRRPMFEQLLIDAPPVVIVWHMDRLVRVSKDLERVLELDLTVHSVTSGHLDLSHPAGRATARTITAWSTYEGEQKALRQRASNEQRAKAGKPWWPVRPFAFEMDGSHNEREKEALIEVYKSILSGASLAGQARRLNEQGLLTTKAGNPWTAMTLRPVLMNARNAGIRTYYGNEYQATWDPIVPEEMWRSVVRMLSNPARGRGPQKGRLPTSLLTGLANCGKCEGVIRLGSRPVHGDPGGASYATYSCRGKHCLSLRVPGVDEIVLDKVADWMLDPDRSEVWERDAEGEAAELREDEQAILAQLDEWTDDRAEGRVSRAQFLRATERLNDRLHAVRGALGKFTPIPDDLRSDSSAAPNKHDLVESLKRLELDRRRHVVEMATVGIALMPLGRGNRTIDERHVAIVFKGWGEQPEAATWQGRSRPVS